MKRLVFRCTDEKNSDIPTKYFLFKYEALGFGVKNKMHVYREHLTADALVQLLNNEGGFILDSVCIYDPSKVIHL